MLLQLVNNNYKRSSIYQYDSYSAFLWLLHRLNFEFPPTGGIVTDGSFQTTKLLRYLSNKDYAIMGKYAFVIHMYVCKHNKKLVQYVVGHVSQLWHSLFDNRARICPCCLHCLLHHWRNHWNRKQKTFVLQKLSQLLRHLCYNGEWVWCTVIITMPWLITINVCIIF